MPPRQKIGTAETDLAAAVVAWLKSPMKRYAKVYQEVSCSGRTADLVVPHADGYGWVIECKRTLGLAVMAQAYDWQRDHKHVSVAAFKTKKRDEGRDFARKVCADYGIGVIEVDEYGTCFERTTPTDKRRITTRIGDILQHCRPEHENFCPAGSQHGAFTPFKATILAVRALLRQDEFKSASLDQIVDGIKHHYKNRSAAKRNLGIWLENYEVCPGFIRSGEGRNRRFSLREDLDVD